MPFFSIFAKIGSFLISNWRFALPILLVGWALYERNGWQECVSDWNAAKLEATNKLLEQKNADAKRRDEIQGKLEDAQEALRRRAVGVVERIREVPASTCPASPALGIANDGLQSLGFIPETRPAK
jgi:hypothetical protein